MDAIEKSITNLKELATKINRASDAVQTALAHYERALQETQIGIEVWLGVVDATIWINYDDDEDRSAAFGEQVGWAKIGGEWRIASQQVTTHWRGSPESARDYVGIAEAGFEWRITRDSDGQPYPAEPVANGSRILRLATLALIPKIIAKLTEEASKVAEQAEAVSKVIEIDEWATRKQKHKSDPGSDDIPF